MSSESSTPAESRDSLVARLSEAVGAEALLLERADLERYERGWRYGQGRAALVVRPHTAEQVSLILRVAAEQGRRVHISGANTGLVGASTPDGTGQQIVISLERLNRCIEIDPIARTASVDAGVTLSQLNAAALPFGLYFPIDLGADPQIGGMIATNTGGSRLIHYGDVRHNLLGLEVVLADGTRWSKLSALRKDNTGLDWKQLFVGTSGSFGVITRAVVELAHLPRQRAAALVAASDGEALLRLLAHLEARTGGNLTAFEVLSRDALEVTLRRGANLKSPFSGEPPRYAALVELSSSLESGQLDLDELLTDALGNFLELSGSAGIEDVLLGKAEEFWNLRHQVSESLAKEGQVIALDIAVPRSRIAAFSTAARERLAVHHPGLRAFDFGHWGDGGTHFNLVYDEAELRRESGPGFDPEALKTAVQTLIYDLCVGDFSGSFSAEHGLGPHNRAFSDRYRPAGQVELEARLAEQFDPDRRLERR